MSEVILAPGAELEPDVVPGPFCLGVATREVGLFVSCDGDAILLRCRRENFPEKTLSAAVTKDGRRNTYSDSMTSMLWPLSRWWWCQTTKLRHGIVV